MMMIIRCVDHLSLRTSSFLSTVRAPENLGTKQHLHDCSSAQRAVSERRRAGGGRLLERGRCTVAMSTTAVADNFQATQLFFKKGDAEATFADLGVPGIGPAGQKNLVDGNENFDGGITNAAQVVGYFLRLNGDKDKMRALLVDKCGCHAPSVDKVPSGTLAALEAKCEGFIAAEADESSAPADAAAGTTKVMAAFQSKQMSWQDTFDSNPVPGLGEVGRQKLKETDGVENAAQLVGLFMTFNGEEDDFTEHLLECGLRKQEIEKDNGILQAIKEKLATFCLPSV